VPSVFFRTNPLPSCCRQPVIDTGFGAVMLEVASGFADAAAVVLADTGVFAGVAAGASGFVAGAAVTVAACGAFDESRTASHNPPAATISISSATGRVHTR